MTGKFKKKSYLFCGTHFLIMVEVCVQLHWLCSLWLCSHICLCLLQKDYARSDLHLTEIFENVCEAFGDYGLTQANDKLGVTRLKDRKTGEDLNAVNVGSNQNLQNTFKSYVSKKMCACK
jgi:hypothetical protein